MNPAPIAIFAYSRPEHFRKTIEALKKNALAKESELFIFSDGPKDEESAKKVEEVRNLAKTISGFKNLHIIERPENFGLAKSIIAGVGEIVNKYGKVIVLEDDLVVSAHFLKYMNDALLAYENNDKIISIHGYVYPIKEILPETFFLKGADCWGWATWKRGWDLFEPDGKKLLKELERRGLVSEFDFGGVYNFSGMLKKQIAGENNSWAIRWYASAFLADKLTLYPGTTLVENIGRDGSGTHGGNSDIFNNAVSARPIEIKPIPAEENIAAKKIIIKKMKSLKPGLLARIVKRLISS